MNILQLVNQDGYNLEILHAGSPNNSFLIGGSVIPLALTSEFKRLEILLSPIGNYEDTDCLYKLVLMANS